MRSKSTLTPTTKVNTSTKNWWIAGLATGFLSLVIIAFSFNFLDIQQILAGTPPTNDNKANAIVIPHAIWNSTPDQFTNKNATPDQLPGSCWNDYDGSGNKNVWFKFQAVKSGITIHVSTTNGNGHLRSPQMALWDAAGNQIACATTGDWVYTDIWISQDSLTNGNWYFVSVDAARNNGSFSMSVLDSANYDYRAHAQVITQNYTSQTDQFSNQYASADEQAGSCWNDYDGSGNKNVWFKFQASKSGVTIHVNTTNGNYHLRSPQMALWDASGNQLACAATGDWVYTDAWICKDSLIIGNWYYISVDAARDNGSFTLSLTDRLNYDYRSAAIVLDNMDDWTSAAEAYSNYFASADGQTASCWNDYDGSGNKNVWFKFKAQTPEVTVTVRTTNGNYHMRAPQLALWKADNTLLSCSTTPDWYYGSPALSYASLTPGAWYYVSVDAARDNGSFTLSIDKHVNNDFHEGAILLSQLDNWTSATDQYTTLYASADRNPGSCWNDYDGTGNRNIWFKFKAMNSSATIKVISTNANLHMRSPQLALFDNNGVEKACVTSANWYYGSITATPTNLIAGQWYYLAVDGAQDNGSFTLYIDNVDKTYYAINNGNWNDANNWSLSPGGSAAGSYPGAADIAVISGYQLNINNTIVAGILKMNASNQDTKLTIDGGSLTLNAYFSMTNTGQNKKTELSLKNNSSMNIGTNAIFTKSGGSKEIKLKIEGSSTFTIGNDMTWISSGGSGEGNKIDIKSSAALSVGHDLNLNYSGGPKIELKLSNNASFTLGNDIHYNTNNPGKLKITFKDNAQIFIQGDLHRDALGYGILSGSGNGTVVFNGIYPQTIPGTNGSGGDNFTYNILKLNNSSSIYPQFITQDTVFIAGQLILTNGIAQTAGNAPFVLLDNATNSGGSVNSHIVGTVIKKGNDAFTFPLGTSTRYMPIGISAPANITDVFSARFIETSPTIAGYDVTQLDAFLNHVSNCEYWTLSQSTGNSPVLITQSWDANSCGITALADLLVAQWNSSQWVSLGNSGFTGTTTQGTLTAATATAGFSVFTVGSGAPTALPVKLIKFEAKANADAVDLYWKTAEELNNDYFSIERSNDGYHFNEIDQMSGYGTTMQAQDYQYTDYYPEPGINYYRLKQVDYNGAFEYSPIVTVDMNQGLANSLAITNVYPNPFNRDFTIDFTLGSDGPLEIIISGQNGALLAHQTFDAYQGSQSFYYPGLDQIAAGIYFLTMRQSGQEATVRIVKY